jgi:hypothetical protein
MRTYMTAAIASILVGTAGAQDVTLSYSGDVIEVVDPLGLFDGVDLGEAVSGVLSFNPAQDQSDPGLPLPGLGFFEGISVTAQLGGSIYEPLDATNVSVIIGNDLPPIGVTPPSTDVVDIFQLSAPIEAPDGANTSPFELTQSNIRAVIQGDPSWIADTSTIPDSDSLGLDNTLSAEVVIEFRQFSFPGTNGEPFSEEASFVIVRLNTLEDADGGIVTIGCRAFQMITPVGVGDFFDVSEFISAFGSGSSAADYNADGEINFFDVSLFVNDFTTSCGIR